MYVNKIENRITFKIKPKYRLQLLTPETIKLLGSTENKITKDKNGGSAPHLEISLDIYFTVILSIMIINKIQEFRINLFLINCLVVY